MESSPHAVRVKICGITRIEDAHAAVEAGVHALGFVFHRPSPRYVSSELAASIIRTLPPFVSTVGVFVNRAREEIEAVAVRAGLQFIQLHGEERPADCDGLSRPVVKAFRYASDQPFPDLEDYSVTGLLIEARVPHLWGGSGVTLDWELFSQQLERHAPTVRNRLVLAGGLSPQNVERAVSVVKPFAVDVSTGVEDAPGMKSPKKIKEFMNALRNSTN